MSLKHAYLVMAHHRQDLLRELLAALDDSRNDIYLHIDTKSGPEMDPWQFSVSASQLHILPAMSVNWGGPSQVRCALEMLRAAVAHGPYAYYHLLTGSSYPLRNQDTIHQFFSEHNGNEFIDYGEAKYSERVRRVWLFSECGKAVDQNALYRGLRVAFLRLQRLLRVDRFRKYEMEYKKGLAYWSITQALAEYALSRRDMIERMVHRSVCADEIFMQVIAWNSEFRERIYDTDGRKDKKIYLTTWELEENGQSRPGHNFTSADLEYLRSSAALFALKFEGACGVGLEQEIRNRWFRCDSGSENG